MNDCELPRQSGETDHAPAPSRRRLGARTVLRAVVKALAAAEPVPALKYELLPGPLERTPGNAATNYYRAMLHIQQAIAAVPKEESQKFYQDYESIFDKPLSEMPKQEMEKWVGYYRNALAETKAAAYREECHFNLRVQDLRGMDTNTARRGPPSRSRKAPAKSPRWRK